MDAAQVQLFLKDTETDQRPKSELVNTNVSIQTVELTYFNNTTEFHITDGQLFMCLLGNNLLQDFLQALANFSLDKGSGSWRVEIRNTIKYKPTLINTNSQINMLYGGTSKTED